MKNTNDFNNSIALISDYLAAFEKGDYKYYIPMSVELRKLLCDRKDSLILAVAPTIRFHKLHMQEIFDNHPSLKEGFKFGFPGKLFTNNFGACLFHLSFSNNMTEVELDEWTSQIIFSGNISIREFIKSVSDKEGAHADREFNSTLLNCKAWSYGNVESHVFGIYAISRYIFDLCVKNRLV